MRWTWPAWTAVTLGALGVACAGALLVSSWETGGAGFTLGIYLVLGGSILLAAGLHGLQSAYASCGDSCGWDGCGCDHCEGCRGDGCCGQCPCYGPKADAQAGPANPGHEGHGHDGGHMH